jgi:hypothetical protein
MKIAVLTYLVACMLLCLLQYSHCQYFQLGTPIQVPAGKGVNEYQFVLDDNNQQAYIDIVDPNESFYFTLQYAPASGSQYDSVAAPRSTPICFFTFTVENQSSMSDLTFGGTLRYIYNKNLFSVNPDTLGIFIYRSAVFRVMQQPSTVTTITSTVTQVFTNNQLMPGTTVFGVWGGSNVTLPANDYDYQLYQRYGVDMNVTANGDQTFKFEGLADYDYISIQIIGSNIDFQFQVFRNTTNPNPNIPFPSGTNTGILYFTVDILDQADPTYNAVFGYTFTSLPDGVDLNSLQIVYVSNGQYTAFSQPPSVSGTSTGGTIVQPASTLQDNLQETTQFAIVGKSTGSSGGSVIGGGVQPGSSGSVATSVDPQSSSTGNHTKTKSKYYLNSAVSGYFQINIFLVIIALSIVALINHLL